jgi:hypothetical protein
VYPASQPSTTSLLIPFPLKDFSRGSKIKDFIRMTKQQANGSHTASGINNYVTRNCSATGSSKSEVKYGQSLIKMT